MATKEKTVFDIYAIINNSTDMSKLYVNPLSAVPDYICFLSLFYWIKSDFKQQDLPKSLTLSNLKNVHPLQVGITSAKHNFK